MSKKHKQKKQAQQPASQKQAASNQSVLNHSVLKKRNAVALNPLLKKSSVHEKTGKAKRTAAKIQLKKTWFERAAVVTAAGQSQDFSRAIARIKTPLIKASAFSVLSARLSAGLQTDAIGH